MAGVTEVSKSTVQLIWNAFHILPLSGSRSTLGGIERGRGSSQQVQREDRSCPAPYV